MHCVRGSSTPHCPASSWRWCRSTTPPSRTTGSAARDAFRDSWRSVSTPGRLSPTCFTLSGHVGKLRCQHSCVAVPLWCVCDTARRHSRSMRRGRRVTVSGRFAAGHKHLMLQLVIYIRSVLRLIYNPGRKDNKTGLQLSCGNLFAFLLSEMRSFSLEFPKQLH